MGDVAIIDLVGIVALDDLVELVVPSSGHGFTLTAAAPTHRGRSRSCGGMLLWIVKEWVNE